MIKLANGKPDRNSLKPGEVLCDYCTAKCCRYFALPIDVPDCREDYDFIRWYLLHEQATVFTEDEDWYLLVHTKCRHLQDNNLCGIYETRPQICRDYTTDNCEYDDKWTYDKYFELPEQMEEFMEVTSSHGTTGSIRSRKPAELPVIAS